MCGHTAEFAHDVGSAAAARRFVADHLVAAGCDDDVVLAAKIAVTELATNAVLHAGSPFSVAVIVEPAVVVIEVTDRSPVPPRLREPGLDGGRGLHLVKGVSERWGSRPTAAGKVVYARVPATRP